MEVTIHNISEYTSLISKIHKEWDTEHSEIWFRGINDSSYDLLPGIVWRGMTEHEENITYDFNISFKPLAIDEVNNSWELYALMQHYGLPTRLLDWSKSPLVALYFALESNASKLNPDRCVWIIDPFELNDICTNESSIFVPTGNGHSELINLENYLPTPLRNNGTSGLLPFPVAIEPPFTNRRILSQQGCFTVHGSDSKPLQNYFIDKKSARIKKVIIPETSRSNLLQELCNLGITEESIYQDLNALSNRIIRVFEKYTKDEKEPAKDNVAEIISTPKSNKSSQQEDSEAGASA